MIAKWHDLFEYKDGILISKVRRNNCTPGKVLGTKDAYGYLVCTVDGVSQKVHRIIYEMHHGYTPNIVDHIDGNKLNNLIENLRPASTDQNQWNRKLNANNVSGVKGVTWVKSSRKWIAQCAVSNKRHYLGLFDSIEDAKQALTKFRIEHQGEYARNE